MFRYLFSAFLKKAEAVEKLAESRPMRRAAQLTAYAAIKAQLAGRDAAAKVLQSNTVRQIRQEAFELPRSVGDMGRKAGRLKDSLRWAAHAAMDAWKRRLLLRAAATAWDAKAL
ncbi:unnamed protein product [Lota lota]